MSQLNDDAQRSIARLPTPELHALLSHYATIFEDILKLRIATGNRVGALEREGILLREPLVIPARGLEGVENAVRKELRRLVRQHPLADFVAETRGFGEVLFARLFGATGPFFPCWTEVDDEGKEKLHGFATVSKLWAFCGMGVDEGKAPRREKGQKTHYSPNARTICHLIGESFVKAGHGPYRDAYDRKKAEYLARERSGPSNCPFGQTHRNGDRLAIACGLAHLDNAAKRYAAKMLLKDLWITWPRETA